MIESAIHKVLTTYVTDVSGRVYHDDAPQKSVLPYVIVSESLIDTNDTKDGVSKLDIMGVQVDLYANDAMQRKNIWSKIEYALDRCSGRIEEVNIQSIQRLPSYSSYDFEAKAYARIGDFKVRVQK